MENLLGKRSLTASDSDDSDSENIIKPQAPSESSTARANNAATINQQLPPSTSRLLDWNSKTITASCKAKPSKKKKFDKDYKQRGEERVLTAASLHEGFLTAKEMQQLQEQGVEIKTGRFDSTEKTLIQNSLHSFCHEHSIDFARILEFMDTKDNSSDARKSFWKEIARPLPNRSFNSIFYHVKRTYDPLNFRHNWSSEEMTRLANLVAQFGKQWKEIGAKMGRSAQACRFRYRVLSAKQSCASDSGDSDPKEKQVRQYSLITAIILEYGRTGEFTASTSNTVSLTDSEVTLEEVTALIDQSFNHWTAAEAVFNKHSVTGALDVDTFRLRWQNNILPRIRALLKDVEEVESESVSYLDLIRLCGVNNRKAPVIEEDIAIIQGIRDQFPDAQRYSDICWSMLSKLPELNERSLMYSQRRFGILAKVVLDKSPEQIKVEKHSKKILRKLQKMTVANSLHDKLYSKHPVAAKCFAKDVSSEIVVVKDVATKPSELSAEFVSDEDDLY